MHRFAFFQYQFVDDLIIGFHVIRLLERVQKLFGFLLNLNCGSITHHFTQYYSAIVFNKLGGESPEK